MKPIVFDKNSWHLHMAETYTSFSSDSYNHMEFGINLCEYIHAVLKGVLLYTLLVFVIIFFTFILIINPIIIISIGLLCGGIIDDGIGSLGICGAVVSAIFCVYALITFLSDKIGKIYNDWKYSKEIIIKPKKSSFLNEAYKSFKNKYCTTITFE